MSPQEVIIISAEIIWKNKLQQQQEVEKRPGEKKSLINGQTHTQLTRGLRGIKKLTYPLINNNTKKKGVVRTKQRIYV